jgi:hypothetical protein
MLVRSPYLGVLAVDSLCASDGGVGHAGYYYLNNNERSVQYLALGVIIYIHNLLTLLSLIFKPLSTLGRK